MPLYEYTCRKCVHAFEALVMGAREEDVRCPECAGNELDRGLGLPARGKVLDAAPATNCRGDGPPCGAARCGRKT